MCDRYSFSGVVYSAAKGLDLHWCKTSETGLPCPDLVLYFKVDPEKVRLRANYGEERYEKVEFQARIAEKYKELFESLPYVKEIDANQDINVVSDQVFDAVESLRLGEKLSTLW